MTDWIHFKAPSGHVIAMTLPLHSTIEQQWEHGDLQRVNEDGTPWGDPAVEESAAAPAQADSQDTSLAETPARPKAAANKAEWQEYAVAIGAATEETAAGMTKAQLVELTTPGEMLPPDPEV